MSKTLFEKSLRKWQESTLKTLIKSVKISFEKSCPEGHRTGTEQEFQRVKIHCMWVVSGQEL